MTWHLRNSMEELKQICPVELSSLETHTTDFFRYVSIRFSEHKDMEKNKENLIKARGEFDLFMTKIISLLYCEDILKTEIDRGLFAFLKDDVGRYMRKLDENEEHLLITFDGRDDNRVSTSRLSSYARILRTGMEMFYSALKHASEEYNNLDKKVKVKNKDGTETEIDVDLNVFLRILFLILSVDLSMHGGVSTQKSSSKGILSTTPTTWRAMFTDQGQTAVKEEFRDRYGKELPFENPNTIQSTETGPAKQEEEEDLFGE